MTNELGLNTTAGLDNQLFVSKYKINLPSLEDEMESFRC